MELYCKKREFLKLCQNSKLKKKRTEWRLRRRRQTIKNKDPAATVDPLKHSAYANSAIHAAH